MPVDPRQLQFTVRGPMRHSNGSFEFTVYVINPSPVLGAPPEIVGEGHIWVNTDIIGHAMSEALRQIAAQLPPEITPSRN